MAALVSFELVYNKRTSLGKQRGAANTFSATIPVLTTYHRYRYTRQRSRHISVVDIPNFHYSRVGFAAAAIGAHG